MMLGTRTHKWGPKCIQWSMVRKRKWEPYSSHVDYFHKWQHLRWLVGSCVCGWFVGTTAEIEITTGLQKMMPRCTGWGRGPRTDIECFLHPLQTYRRCLRTFICCGWAADGFTIIPHSLSPYSCWPRIKKVDQILVLVSQWGYKWSLCIGSGTNQIHMEWFPHPLQTSVLDGQMDTPSFHFHHTCWPGIKEVDQILWSWDPWFIIDFCD